jgi:hypothetical protein
MTIHLELLTEIPRHIADRLYVFTAKAVSRHTRTRIQLLVMITIRESLLLLHPSPPTHHGMVMTNLPRSSADLAVSAPPSLQACDNRRGQPYTFQTQ